MSTLLSTALYLVHLYGQYLGETETELVRIEADFLQTQVACRPIILGVVHLLRSQDDVALGRERRPISCVLAL